MQATSLDTQSNWSLCWTQWEDSECLTSGIHTGPCKLKGPHSFTSDLYFLEGSWSCTQLFCDWKSWAALPYASSMCHAVWGWGGEKKHACWKHSSPLLEVNLILSLAVAAPQKTGLKDYFIFLSLKQIFVICCWKTSKYSQRLNTKGTKNFTFSLRAMFHDADSV